MHCLMTELYDANNDNIWLQYTSYLTLKLCQEEQPENFSRIMFKGLEEDKPHPLIDALYSNSVTDNSVSLNPMIPTFSFERSSQQLQSSLAFATQHNAMWSSSLPTELLSQSQRSRPSQAQIRHRMMLSQVGNRSSFSKGLFSVCIFLIKFLFFYRNTTVFIISSI